MKKTLALLLALAMLFSLAACGKSAVDMDAVGTYYCIEAERDYGINWPDGERIELYEDGTCIFYEGELSGWETPGTWTLDGKDLTLRFYGEKYEADLSRGELELEDYNCASYLFSDDEDDIPSEDERPQQPAADSGTAAPGYAPSDADFDVSYYTGSYGVTYSSQPMQGEYVELYDDLTGMISTGFGVEYFSWYMYGDTICFYMDSGYYEGYNDGFDMELNYFGVYYVFEWEVEPYYSDVAEESVADIDYDYWNREWYGWWVITDGYGTWSDAIGNWWDCCASITVGTDASAYIELWDEDLPRYDALSFSEGYHYSYGDGPGYLLMDSGFFLDGRVDYWDVDPSYSNYDQMLSIDGYYEDPNNSGDYFYYTIYLRPWGYIWSDVEAESPDDLPYYYYDWYLPLVEAGMSAPDTVG